MLAPTAAATGERAATVSTTASSTTPSATRSTAQSAARTLLPRDATCASPRWCPGTSMSNGAVAVTDRFGAVDACSTRVRVESVVGLAAPSAHQVTRCRAPFVWSWDSYTDAPGCPVSPASGRRTVRPRAGAGGSRDQTCRRAVRPNRSSGRRSAGRRRDTCSLLRREPLARLVGRGRI